MPVSATRSLAILICCLLLSGCKLVDQRTFDHNAGRKPVPPAPPAPPSGPGPIPPLFVVHAGQPTDDWQPTLHAAVAEALARKPNALFTIESVVPVAASPAKQAAALRAATASNGRPVADAIIEDGAQPTQVEMSARSDRAAKIPEVRVYVR